MAIVMSNLGLGTSLARLQNSEPVLNPTVNQWRFLRQKTTCNLMTLHKTTMYSFYSQEKMIIYTLYSWISNKPLFSVLWITVIHLFHWVVVGMRRFYLCYFTLIDWFSLKKYKIIWRLIYSQYNIHLNFTRIYVYSFISIVHDCRYIYFFLFLLNFIKF